MSDTFTDKMIQEIKEASKNVPFGSSEFQNIYFSANQETPERKYRHLVLQMDQKINTLQHCKFNRDRIELAIEELEYKIHSCEPDSFEARKLKIDLKEKQWALNNEVKLIEDAIIELVTFYSMFKQLPSIDRLTFEKQEKVYWTERLLREAKASVLSTGSIEQGLSLALSHIGIDPVAAQVELKQLNNEQAQLFIENKKNLTLEKK